MVAVARNRHLINGEYLTVPEMAEKYKVPRRLLYYRIKILKARGHDIALAVNQDYWYKRRIAEEKPSITPEEMEMLKRIPGPSSLERRVFG